MMQVRDTDVFCVQLLTYLVTRHNYQIVTLRQNEIVDFWLTNSQHPQYPIIRLSGDSCTDLSELDNYLKSICRVIEMAVGIKANLLVINTDPESQSTEYDGIKQYVVTENQSVDASLLAVFPEIDKVCHRVENNEQEMLKCSRILDKRARIQARRNRKIPFNKMPKLTLGLIILCTVVYFLVNLLYVKVAQFATDGNINAVLTGAASSLGAYYKMAVVGTHEYWRLLSAGFVHADVFHLLMNMMALFNLGFYCEKRFSKKQYLLILLASIIGGNLFVLIGDANIAGMGISGGLFGLLGAYAVSLFVDGSLRRRMIRINLTSMVMMNIFISLLPNVSLMAHLGGFIVGGLLAFVMIGKKRWPTLQVHTRNAFVLLILGLLFLVPRSQRIEPFYVTTDAYLITTAESFNLNGYADYLKKSFIQTAQKQEETYYEIQLEAALQQLHGGK